MRDAETDADLDAIVAEGRCLTVGCSGAAPAGWRARLPDRPVPRPACHCRSWR